MDIISSQTLRGDPPAAGGNAPPGPGPSTQSAGGSGGGGGGGGSVPPDTTPPEQPTPTDPVIEETVTSVADAPTLEVSAASGDEDTAIALDIASALTDASEVLSVTISGIPEGATLSAGTIVDGAVTLTPAQLGSLTITPPADSDADFDLTVTATSTDGTDTATTTATLPVTVAAVADAPTLEVSAASGDEDTAISLDIATALTDTDGSEVLSVTISGIPAGATLSTGTIVDGAVTLAAGDLAGLTITPPADSDADFDLTVTATSTDGTDTATSTATLPVTVAAVADAPTLEVSAASGDEDTAIALDIASALTDTDGSEVLSVTISGIPVGATLSTGTIVGGAVTLAASDLAGLTITPPADSDADFDLTVTATSTDGTDTATTTATLPVTVAAVADAPTLEVSAASGDEDTAIALDITSALTDTDGSEVLSVTVSGIPAGATLSTGTIVDGAVTLAPGDLAGLTITPPTDSDADFDLTVTATSTDGTDTATTTATLPVTVAAVADTPTLEVSAASGDEDTAITLDVSAALTDASEVLSVTISGIPEGATLSTGTIVDGAVTLAVGDLAGLTITPPADSDADFDLTVTATSTDGTDTATTTATLPVTVAAVADAPTLEVSAASGDEDTAIALDIASALTDTDGSEVLSVTISGIPAGAALSAGTVNEDGSVTLTPAQLGSLTITPSADSDADFDLTVTATSTDGTDTATTTATLPVTVAAVADTPTLEVSAASGDEDTAISLDVASALTDTDGSEVLSVTISGIPAGATLSAGTIVDGAVTLTAAQLADLTITPPADSDADFDLTVTATSTDGTDTATTTATLPVTVAAVADTPTLEVSAASGDEDTAIALDIASALADTDGSEVLSVTISGIPEGATLSAGTIVDGAVALAAGDLAGLTVTPPADSDADFDLTVTATSTDGTDTATTTATLPVTVAAVADAPTLEVSAASGDEDTAISLDITSALTDTDGSEVLSVTISGIPAGATLSTGTIVDGAVTLAAGDLAGLTITPPADSDADFDLTVTATSTDGTDTATTTATLPVTVAAVADAPTLEVSAASGDEDTAIALDIASALTDASEVLSVTISGIPEGATLSAGTVVDGAVTLAPGDLASLTITPPADSDADFDLTVTATSMDGTDTATTTATLPVTVAAVADAPTLEVSAASGDEDAAIALDIASALTDTDGSEVLSVTISTIPVGAVLSAGTVNEDGSVTLTAAQLGSLTITPPADSDADFDLTVTATSTDGTDKATTTATLPVTVAAVADAPTLEVSAASGAEDTAISLDIASALTDTDGSEVLSVTISGIPEGATLSTGTIVDGAVILTPVQLAGLTITPPADSDADFDLTVTATSTDGTDTATTTATLPVTVAAVADAPTLEVSAASGDEDTAIALDIASALTDTDGSEVLSVTISGIPEGATLSTGTIVDGAVTLAAGDLAGLTITPPADSDADFDLTVTATSTDGTDTATTTATLPVTVAAVNDAPEIDGVQSQTVQMQPVLFQHEMQTDTQFPELREAVAISDDAINGVNMEDLTLTADNPVSVTFINESAGFHNTVGMYKIGADGQITDVEIIWANASAQGSGGTLVPGETTVELDVAAGESFAFFVVAQGDKLNDYDSFPDGSFEFRDGEAGATVDSVAPRLVFAGDDGSVTGINSYGIFHSTGTESGVQLNTDGELHTVSGLDENGAGLMIGFEDTQRQGDHDFGDLVIRVDFGDKVGHTLPPISVFPDIEISDVDSNVIAGAEITIDSGMQPGDTLQLGALDGTGVSITAQGLDAETGVYRVVLAGTATIIAYQAILAELQLTNANEDVAPGLREISVSVTDDTGMVSTIAEADITLLPADVITGADADGTLTGGDGNDAIDAAGGNDVVFGGGGDDLLIGGQGDDILLGGTGGDNIVGGAGSDTASFAGSSAGVTVDLSAGTASGGDAEGDVLHGIENLTGSDLNDILTGDSGDNILLGGLGDDLLAGAGGADEIDGGAGTDTVRIDLTAADLENPALLSEINQFAQFIAANADTGSATGEGPSFTFTTLDGLTIRNIEELDVTIDGVPFDFAPVIEALATPAPLQTTMDAEDSAEAVFGDLTISDVDGTELSGAVVEIDLGYQDGDMLILPDVGLEGTNVTVVSSEFDADDNVYRLVLSGDDAISNYQSILQTVRLGNTDDVRDAGTRNVRFQITDTDGNVSQAANVSVVVEEIQLDTLAHENTGKGSDKTNYVLVDEMDDDSVRVVEAGDMRNGNAAEARWEVESDGRSRSATEDDLDGVRYEAVDQGRGTDWVIADEGVDEDLTIDLSNGVWQTTEHAAGGRGDDVLTGNSSKNLLMGGAGDDTLIGSDNKDVLLGGSGDDLFIMDVDDLTNESMHQKVDIKGADDRLLDIIDANDAGEDTDITSQMRSGVDGGSGHDTLRITTDEDVTIDVGRDDFKKFDEGVDNIEAIDLRYGEGDVTLRLDLDDVIDLTDDNNELQVFRNDGDSVQIDEDAVASAAGAEVDGFTTFTFFDNGGGVLGKVHVQDDQPAV